MKWIQSHRKIANYLFMITGTLLIACAMQYLYDPVGLVTGGFSGVSIILKNLNGNLPLWLTTLVLNVPLFLVAIKVCGWSYVRNSVFSTLMLSLWLYVLPAATFQENDMFLISVFGGIITGAGTGLVFLADSTTGGTDLLAAVIQKFLPQYSVAQILQVVDGAVVILGAYIFGIRAAMYAIVAIVLVTKVSDGILEGLKFAKLLYIISDHYDEIAQKIMATMDRGVTGLDGSGMYTGQKRKILMCVVSKKEVFRVKQLVYAIDPDAFVILGDVREVVGEGFIENAHL